MIRTVRRRSFLALTLINRGQVSGNDFDEREGGYALLYRSMIPVVALWSLLGRNANRGRIKPLTENEVRVALLPFLQARFLARTFAMKWKGTYRSWQNRDTKC